MTYALKFQDLSLGYDRQPAVHRLQGEIAEGSLTAIVGPNGAGKSTVLKGVTGSLRPLEGRIAFGGLARDDIACLQDVARLIERIRDEGISAVFLENITDGRLLEQIANETGATIGGTLYPGALSGPDDPAPTYLDMMRHNATTLAQALAP